MVAWRRIGRSEVHVKPDRNRGQIDLHSMASTSIDGGFGARPTPAAPRAAEPDSGPGLAADDAADATPAPGRFRSWRRLAWDGSPVTSAGSRHPHELAQRRRVDQALDLERRPSPGPVDRSANALTRRMAIPRGAATPTRSHPDAQPAHAPESDL